MSEARCPMCGRANPAELDQCQYCQARLRPIWDTASKDGSPDSSDNQPSDLPEWLKSLRTPDQQQDDQLAPSQEGQGALPDWLGELRKQPGETAGSPSDEISDDRIAESGESQSRWLQDILGEDDLSKEGTFNEQVDDVFPHEEARWMSRIGSTPVEEEHPLSSSDAPNWLAELEQAAPDLGAPGAQDWYSPQTSQPLESAEQLPDWLFQEKPEASGRLGQETSEPEGTVEPEQLEEPVVQDELPDWLQQAANFIQGPAEPGEVATSSDWTRLEPAESAAPESESDEVMNWLAGEDEELPEWLFAQPLQVEPAESAEIIPPPSIGENDLGSDDLMKWPVAQEEDLPDWLKTSPEASEEIPDLPLTTEELLPAGLFTEEPSNGELQQASAMEETETPGKEALPWLAGAAGTAAAAGLFLSDEQDEENLGWLDELETTYGSLSPNAPEPTAAPMGEEESAQLEPGSALPIWLAKASEEEILDQEAGVEGEGELSRADLPSWLQAMKPVGVTAAAAAMTGEPESQQIEGAGPLAGLRGALPAEPDVSQAPKPPVYSVKLHVTEPQQIQAELLRSLIEAEGQPQALPRRPVVSSQDIVRLFMAVLLIFPILFVMLTGFPQFGLPPSSMEVNAVGKMIDGLAPGAPVLLAVDYQPGFAGEMDAVTLPVVQHLFEKGAYLALVSTIATGPVQAEQLLSQVRSASDAPLQISANSVNLGYIPGGATGVLGFAQSPREVLPTSLRGEQAWDAAGLQGIDSLEKFAMVLVATENPDIARYWVEQVQPQLGATPLVLVLSAQAEPMIWPYYYANPSQVQGLVGGLAGGAAYLVRNAQSGEATQFWSPYSAGVLVAVLLMILGGVMYLISARIALQKEKTGGQKRP